jgi:hypothetical protein
MQTVHATPQEVAKFSQLAIEISHLFAESGIKRSEGLDVLAMVIICMMIALEMPPDEAHAMADGLAECIKINYDLQRRDFEPLN